MDKEVTEVLKNVRDLFLDKEVYLGGSQALSLAITNIMKPESDVDIFILGSRSMASYLLKDALLNIFDLVYISKGIEYAKYKIPQQIKLAKAVKDEIEYDLIFVDIDIKGLVSKCSSSDLGRVYYEVTFAECPLRLASYSEIPVDNIGYKNIDVDISKGTVENINKVNKYCQIHGIDMSCI